MHDINRMSGMSSGQRRIEALGESEAFMDFHERVSRVAKVDRAVLIIGERGTGKELAVERLHFLSNRWQGPLVTLNCAALSPSVLESELFGHEAGAFTGATRRRLGRFESAEGGTLFLDEIGLIPMTVQEKILRVVEYGQFERVGGSDPVSVDVRIVGATNANLPEMVAAGQFKADLLDRLSFEVLRVPPLRERQDDVILLAYHFAARMSQELGWRESPRFTEPVMAALRQHDWPGNVRELKNVVERAVYASGGAAIDRIELDPFSGVFPRVPIRASAVEARQTAAAGQECAVSPRVATAETPVASADAPMDLADWVARLKWPVALPEVMRTLEVELLRRALALAQYHQKRAAAALGLGYHQFRALYRKHHEAFAVKSKEE